ncbi:hypothetical protein SAMN06265365_102254 [Tistlia consotensis]|uniref:Uncharacterized protein n=1 Tax=Tistlia consotensis USBA 355 TaxID=560819 RepID=A0A1Y6BH61_9PROT|nr:hypothetical protein [Tistlia consotensis]SMF07441.1 hypothetical protein SAMN05428998_10462 [Tistlia consotensis USBA 355]SNR35894.1 hypothetical protein SAMN06265365_102254 [Tistlia consotensis]
MSAAPSSPSVGGPLSKRTRGAILHLSIFACSVMLVLAAARWYDRSDRLLRLERTEYQAGIPDISAGTYLGSRGTSLAYNAFAYDWDHVVDAARKADVLFLGNSRAVYGFRPQYFQPWLDKIGLRGFNMAFFGGGGFAPLYVIRKFDLHPKMVVINDDGFFLLRDTAWGKAARTEGPWRAFKDYYSKTARWLVQKRLHQIVPPLRAFTGRRSLVVYRSIRDGAPIFAFGESEGKPMTRLPPDEPSRAMRELVDQSLPIVRAGSKKFLEEMDRRGILVVLTAIQDNGEFAGYYLAKALNEENRRIYVHAMLPNLMGQAGSHMDAWSSKRLMDDLMPKILALPQVQALARKPAGTRP